MMQAFRNFLLGFLAVAIVGCQGAQVAGLASLASGKSVEGAAASAVDTRPRGFLKLAIRWPSGPGMDLRGYHSQLIPDSTATLKVTVRDSGNVQIGSPTTVNRPAGQALTNVTIELRAATNLNVSVQAYPANPNDATEIANGAASGINIYSSADTSATVTLASLWTPSISSLSSNSGAVNHSITLTGSNFKPAWAATPTVYFNGTAATPTSSSNTSITVAVPTGATVGNVTVKADGVTSVSSANYYVISSLAITAAAITLGGHPVTAGMVYYGDTLDFTALATFALKSGETLTSTWTNPPAPNWTSANANNTIATQTGPTIGATTTTTVGRMQSAATNQTGNITATIGSVTSAAILAQPVGVDSVTLNASSVTLNAMPPSGTSVSATYLAQTTGTVTATVNHTLPFNDGVTWTDGGNGIATSTSGTGSITITTAAGTAAGSSTLKATSITKTTVSSSQIPITITDYGDLVLGVQ